MGRKIFTFELGLQATCHEHSDFLGKRRKIATTDLNRSFIRSCRKLCINGQSLQSMESSINKNTINSRKGTP